MDTAAIIAKVVGIALLAFTVRSAYKHFRGRKAKKNDIRHPSSDIRSPSSDKPEPSKVEQTLNTLLLYAWFMFMTAFSLGMIFNN